MLAGLALSGCRSSGGAGDAAPAASASAAPSSSTPTARPQSDELRPIYPLDTEPSPLAERVCTLLHRLPETRRGACCQRPATEPMQAGLCVRTVSAALLARAVTVDVERIDACEKALVQT